MSEKNLDESKEPGQSLERVADGFRVRLRFGEGKQGRFVLRTDSEAEAQNRAKALRELVSSLAKSGRRAVEISIIVRNLAEASREEFATMLELVRASVPASKATAPRKVTTFEQLADEWTSGRLHRSYPDHVKAKSSVGDDEQRLSVLCQRVGGVPLDRFTIEHAELAMASLPDGLSSATRRQYAQVLSKVLKLAVYPCRIIDSNPIPPGFLPKVKGSKAKAWLYPSEDAALLACKEVPFARRVLWGLLAREGMRLGEAMALRWGDLDLERGTIRLDVNKTDDPRMWALGSDVVSALVSFKPKNVAPTVNVFAPFASGPSRAARVFRDDLKAAGIDRAELFESTESRLSVRAHDLRGSFVTLALASGRSEAWVSDRTGHKSSAMINRYRRAARAASELALGWFIPLNLALPETRPESENPVRVSHGVSQALDDLEGAPVETGSDSAEFAPYMIVGRKGLEPLTYGLKERPEGAANSHEAENSSTRDALRAESSPSDSPLTHPPDPIEEALGESLKAATLASRWEVVALLAKELEVRRLARESASNVIPLSPRKDRTR